MKQISATQTRFRDIRVLDANDLMANCSELEQAERIAKHYMHLFVTAQHLNKIIELSKYSEITDDTKSAIQYLLNQLKEYHAYELGIELSRATPTP